MAMRQDATEQKLAAWQPTRGLHPGRHRERRLPVGRADEAG